MTRKVPAIAALVFAFAGSIAVTSPSLAALTEKSVTVRENVADGLVLPPRFRTSSVPAQRIISHEPGKLIVKLKEGKNAGDIKKLREKHGLKISEKKLANVSHHRFRDLYDLKGGNKADIIAIAAELRNHPAVEYAEPNYLLLTQSIPNDTSYPSQWSHQKTEAEAGWDITSGDPAIVVAVVDTGVFYDHPDLAANIWRDAANNPGKDFVDINLASYIGDGYQAITGEDYQTPDNDPGDYNGHGTHVAGIIAAVGNNGQGVIGVCPNCKIMPVRAGFSISYQGRHYGALEDDDIANAIIYAADNGARIINMSFGGPASQLQKDAIDYAVAKGVVLIAAAGNDNISSTDYAYPAASGEVLAVAATTTDDSRASYSNYGPWVGVAAPGGGGELSNGIMSTVPLVGSHSNPTGYASMSGTSMAAPYVAGLAGLILSQNPSLTRHEVYQKLRQGVDAFNVDIPVPSFYIGTGRVNVRKALQIGPVSTATAEISSPANGFLTGSNLPITGSAGAPYRLSYGVGIYPTSWTEIASGPAGSVTATLDLASLPSPFELYTFKLTAEDQAGKVETIVQGEIGTRFLPGWPVTYQAQQSPVWNSPNLADLDGDGFAEIIVTGQDSLYRGIISVYRHDGTLAEGDWPQTLPITGSTFAYGAAVGDLNNDGDLEIVAPYYTGGRGHALMAWDRRGNLLWSKVQDPDNPPLSVTLADINGDGYPEIVVETYNSKLYALDHNGEPLWSTPVNEYDSWYNDKVVAVADLDGDGKKEIAKNVITTLKYDPGDTYRTMGGSLVLFNADGTFRWHHNWPEPGEDLNTPYYGIYPVFSPVIGDINHDGSAEIMVVVRVWKSSLNDERVDKSRIYAFDDAGSVLPGWPVEIDEGPTTALALTDLQQNGHLNVILGTVDYLHHQDWENHVHALTDTGQFLFPSVPLISATGFSSADVTGDGRPDIVFSDGSSFYAIQADGAVSTLPLRGNPRLNNLVLTDLNRDGSEDLVFLEYYNRPALWAWDLKVPHVAAAEQWSLFAYDPQHTSFYDKFPLVMAITNRPPLPDGTLGCVYSQPLAVARGKAPYTWATSGGSLPDGLILDSATGMISGTPTAPGTFSFSITVTGSDQRTASKEFSLDIRAPFQGSVTDSSGHGWPLYASLTFTSSGDSRTIFTNPLTGSYSVDLSPGTTYTVTVDSTGYTRETRQIAAIVGGSENFGLTVDAASCGAPGYSGLFNASFEGNSSVFTAGGYTTTWAWGTPSSGPGVAHSGTAVWGTNLSGNYDSWEDGTLTSAAIDLSAAAGQPLTLSWWQWLQTEDGYDYASIEVSNDGGISWTVVYGPATGDVDLAWTRHSLSLSSAYAVGNFRVRFSFTSDNSIEFPGWYLDDVAIAAQSPCQPVPGGLVVGNVTAADNGAPLTNATVSDGTGRSATASQTPSDQALGEAFYILFVPAGTASLTASHGLYGNVTRVVNVTAETVQQQDFVLDSCSYVVSPAEVSFPSAGGTGTVQVITTNGCAWDAASNAEWLTITEGSSGTGTATVTFQVSLNAIMTPRTGTMTISGKTVTIAQAGPVQLQVEVTPLNGGSVSGGGIQCPGTCSAWHDTGTTVTLTATPTTGYEFTGWDSCDKVTGAVCETLMTTGRTCKATFSLLPLKKSGVGGASSFYRTLQAALDGASPDDVIQTRVASFSENILFSLNVAITISGGFNEDFTVVQGATEIAGSITVSAGTITMENIVIR